MSTRCYAQRDERGRFVAETQAAYGRQTWRQRTQAQSRYMAAGPRLDDDDHTLIVPSEWYNKQAKEFW